ncbi:MAG: lipoyl(octanoyl) transferase LipB [Armatimonadota bacterium]|nr:lipoyl(octanoyl) transferase LipB [Armatimonadota bacterium]MCX7778328.1 lipoyl(octanoyl) transferase LipB [Armatimonadota bacterium]MDW8026393.1 lipoyl(octanoyl) transferase LipB [Armatimonadota bacterium]
MYAVGTIEVHDLGRHVPYDECLQLQESLLNLRLRNLISNKLLLLEHEPTITIGRSGSVDGLLCKPDELTSLGIKVIECNRGGKAMLHLPGQVVAYAIVHLRQLKIDVMQFVHSLEFAMIKVLAKRGINAAMIDHPGVWVFVNGKWMKVGFVGIAVRRWVTMHGLALNASVELSMFELIKPCGLSPSSITDMVSLLQTEVDIDWIKRELAIQISSALNVQPVFISDGFERLLFEALEFKAVR